MSISEKLNDRHILIIQNFNRPAILRKLNDKHILLKQICAVNEMTGILKYSAEILIPGRNSEIFLFVEN